MYVEQLWGGKKTKVKRQEDSVRLVRREGCAEEDDEDEDGGNRESDGQDEGEEGRLQSLSVNVARPSYSL